jgi:predicted Zn finger-like uncharacterized protein
MIITCPDCNTKFRIDEEKLRPEGSKLRCGRCGFVFVATALDGEAESEKAPPSEPKADPAEQQHTAPEATAATESEEDVADPEEIAEDSLSGISELAADDTPGDLSEFAEEEAEPRSKRRTWLLVLLLVLAAAAAGYYLFPRFQSSIPFLSSLTPSVQMVESAKASQTRPLEGFSLREVRQYVVHNKNFGPLLVIQGKVVNNSSQERKKVKVRAKLHDMKGHVLQSKAFYCGNALSLFQLKVLGKDKLFSSLNSDAGVLSMGGVAPGQEVQFMTAFPQPPAQLGEFSLQVLQERTLASKS